MNKSNEQRPSWYSHLEENPVPAKTFTARELTDFSNRLRTTGSSGKQRRLRIRRALTYSAVGLLAVLLLGGLILPSPLKEYIIVSNPASQQVMQPSGQEQSLAIFSREGQLLVEALPGGELLAGKEAGCWWNIYLPYEEIQGQQISILATHQETGLRITELPPTEIVESMRYDDFIRIPTALGLPIGGAWTFEMTLNNETLGNIVILVPEANWVTSPEFQSGVYDMIGTKDHLGLLSPGFVANSPNKFMWHLWGSNEKLSGDFQVYGVKKGSNQLEEVLTSEITPGSLNGADATVHCLMSLPSSGQWKLIVIINGQWFGDIVVEVSDS